MRDAPVQVGARDSTAAPRLRPVLSLWDLIFYGIVLIQPIAPVPLFGVVQERSHGFIVDTILVAMLAMTITAFSYGRMAALYACAGSAYTYVGRGLNLHLGFLVGWAMFLDYLLQPLLNPTSTVGSEFFVVFVDKPFVPCNISLSALNSDEYIEYFT